MGPTRFLSSRFKHPNKRGRVPFTVPCIESDLPRPQPWKSGTRHNNSERDAAASVLWHHLAVLAINLAINYLIMSLNFTRASIASSPRSTAVQTSVLRFDGFPRATPTRCNHKPIDTVPGSRGYPRGDSCWGLVSQIRSSLCAIIRRYRSRASSVAPWHNIIARTRLIL